MAAERGGPDIPEWARQERQRDIAWITENMRIFASAARSAFREGGRGAIVVDTTQTPIAGMGHPFGYYLQETIEGTEDEDAKRMVAEYDPVKEFVIVMLKPEERVSTYRVQVVEKVKRGRPRRGR